MEHCVVVDVRGVGGDARREHVESRTIRSPSGERLTDEEVDSVIKFTDLQEDLDGNVKYEGTSCVGWVHTTAGFTHGLG